MQKDTQIANATTKDISEEIAKSFIPDNRLFYISKRASKITKALCLVTSHIDDNLDIKGRIQKDALDLSDIILSLSYKESSEITKIKARAFSKIMSLTSMVEIMDSLGQISKTNSAILLGQIKLFVTEVEEYFNMSDTTSSLSLQLFDFDEGIFNRDVSDNQPVAQSPRAISDIADSKQGVTIKSGSVIEDTKIQTKVVRSSFHPTNTEFKQRLFTAKSIEQLHGAEDKEVKKTPVARNLIQGDTTGQRIGVQNTDISIKNESKNDRQTAIINTISIKGELSIKDLSTVIKGCSEKTIQRELISLVERGILNKTGERRWSRYSLSH